MVTEMGKCILTRGLSQDANTFPLLENDSVPFSDGDYPVSVSFSDDSIHPLFKGGIATREDIETAVDGIAQDIADRYRGKKQLIVNILEGGTHFYEGIMTRLRVPIAQSEFIAGGSVKVQRYAGTEARGLTIVRPLQDEHGNEITDLSPFDAVILLDDLVDTGGTPIPLIHQYRGEARELAVYFLFEKDNPQRLKDIGDFLSHYNPLNGISVPNEWIVGHGPNISLPGKDSIPPLHLFRELPDGGLYAFNDVIEDRLIEEYQKGPEFIKGQLQSYVTDK